MQKNGSILDGLDRFIRKYYKNRMIKGALYSLCLLLSLFLIIALLEYFGYFGTVVRAILFWSYLLIGILVIGYYVIIPLTKMFRIGKVISYEDAARIVGEHFPEVKDKLLNLIQLQSIGNDSSDELLIAAIAQKTSELKVVPFHQAVDTKSNRKYVKYAAIPLAICLLIFIISPTLLTKPSHRITHYTTQFERPAPFSFVVENEVLQVNQYEDFNLNVSVKGDAVPAEVHIRIDGMPYLMKQHGKGQFSYLFKNVQRSSRFSMEAVGVTSQEYELQVFLKPSIESFEVELTYPAYTGRSKETLCNEGNIVVPQGTQVKWVFATRDVDTLHFFTDNISKTLISNGKKTLSYSAGAMKSFGYGFTVSNKYSAISDTLSYSVTAVGDALPMIGVVEHRDSVKGDGSVSFFGRIKDDYGFSKLEFKLLKTNVDDTSVREFSSRPITITQESVQEFYYVADFGKMELNTGDRLVYYFEVWDNDGLHGPKSATSQQFEMVVPTQKELDSVLVCNSKDIQQSASKSLDELKKMQKEINELMRKFVDKNELNWHDKKELQELQKKQEQIKDMFQQMQKRMGESKNLEQRYKEQSENLLDKQQKLEQLMEEVLSDEIKEALRQLEEMLSEMDKDKVQKQLDQLKMKNEDLEKQIDQNIELMKRLDLEKKLEDAIILTKQLSKNQYNISEKTKNTENKSELESLLREQQQLSLQFDQLKQNLFQLKQEYKDIDEGLDFRVDYELMNRIDQSQQVAENNLREGKKKEASKRQDEAAGQLEQLSEQLSEVQQDLEQQGMAEDAESIRRLLKNIVRLSYDQESLIPEIRNTHTQDVQYQEIIHEQNRIKSDFKGVEDSLRAIAKRQVQVASVVNKNLSEVNAGLARSLNDLLGTSYMFNKAYRYSWYSASMQYTMTALNNLALVLAESLDQMQDQMRQSSKKKGNSNSSGQKKMGNCSNPGKGKSSAKSMKELQDELNKQMESLKKRMEKEGNKGNEGQRKRLGDKEQGKVSEEFARMAAQQERIRRMMQEYGQRMKESSGGNSKLAREIDQLVRQMEQTERDLVNRIINQRTIQRQQQILTRLLKHEKAEMEREKDNARESKEGKDIFRQPLQDEIDKLNKLQEGNTELFRTVPPTLSPYYKSKVADYFYKF